MILGAIVDAHNGDKSMDTEKKYDDARPTARNCFHNPSNPCFYTPYHFNVRIIKNAFSKKVLKNLCDYLEYVEEYDESTNISTTLQKSDSPLWFLNKADSALFDACEFVTSAYENSVDKDEVLDTFQDFFLLSYLTYKVGKNSWPVKHQNVEGVFSSAILIIKDSLRGRLHITNVDLPEEFDNGDLILMDPCVFYSVTEFER